MTRSIACSLALALLVAGTARAQDMPDPSQIHGKALSASELPDGTVTVRVVREAIGNNLAGQQVRVTSDGRSFTATTDELGRAEFKTLPRGAEARAEATVEGESLVSEPFMVPATGGLRVILVSGIARAAERRTREQAEALAAPPIRGVVWFGGETRIIAELQSDTLTFFYHLEIVNSARTRVDIGGPIVFDLPKGAAGAATASNAPKSATLNGTRLTVVGPFNPGSTTIDLSFQLPHSHPSMTVTQTWPVELKEWLVAMEKVANVSISSPQFVGGPEDRSTETAIYMVGTGHPIQAGSALSMQFGNLPVQGQISTRVALGLAILLIAAGVWLSVRRRPEDETSRDALAARRETLLTRLAALENSHRTGAIGDDRYRAKRERLLSDLEEVYGELDEVAGPPRGGGEDVAA